jgi:hypothetical protein
MQCLQKMEPVCMARNLESIARKSSLLARGTHFPLSFFRSSVVLSQVTSSLLFPLIYRKHLRTWLTAVEPINFRDILRL